MDENKVIEPMIDNSIYTHYVGVRFIGGNRSYYFGVINNMPLELEEKVVVETQRGTELGIVSSELFEIDEYKSELGLKPILRKATEADIRMYELNQKDAKFALEICQAEVTRLNLDMNLISCEYTLDKSKVLFSYLSDDRVDFRELLKALAAKLHTRIELRQVGPRDKAKMVGGIGICGLPLCCSTFLNEFDGISINRAKNQMLAINIPKLSGQCGKLICCLKYEDDTYSIEKKDFPDLGTKVWIDKVEYTITNINIVSRVIKIENAEDVKFLEYEELKKQIDSPSKLNKKPFKKDEKNVSEESKTENTPKDSTKVENHNKNNNKNRQNNHQQNNNHNRNNNRPNNGQQNNNRPQNRKPNNNDNKK